MIYFCYPETYFQIFGKCPERVPCSTVWNRWNVHSLIDEIMNSLYAVGMSFTWVRLFKTGRWIFVSNADVRS